MALSQLLPAYIHAFELQQGNIYSSTWKQLEPAETYPLSPIAVDLLQQGNDKGLLSAPGWSIEEKVGTVSSFYLP